MRRKADYRNAHLLKDIAMLSTILALLPKISSAVAALPEFAKLIRDAKAAMSEDDQAVLQSAYDLAIAGSDQAHADLQALVAARI